MAGSCPTSPTADNDWLHFLDCKTWQAIVHLGTGQNVFIHGDEGSANFGGPFDLHYDSEHRGILVGRTGTDVTRTLHICNDLFKSELCWTKRTAASEPELCVVDRGGGGARAGSVKFRNILEADVVTKVSACRYVCVFCQPFKRLCWHVPLPPLEESFFCLRVLAPIKH
jgi:hypothetical protein